MLISAGNIRDNLSKADYPARNQTEPIENPAQAWNAITVGAYTEKATLVDPSYADWEPIAPVGGLSPTSRTSLTWEKKWPIKPDVVLEGGNWAALGDQCDCPDDLGLLTTYRDPTTRHFDIFRDTSAATAMAGNLAGKILAVVPERWPETIRALIVHSAEWTPLMKQQFDSATSEQQRRAVLRQYGYGVPSYERAIFSALNDLTLIAEDELQPLWKDNEDGVAAPLERQFGRIAGVTEMTSTSFRGRALSWSSWQRPRSNSALLSRILSSQILASAAGFADTDTPLTGSGLQSRCRSSPSMHFASVLTPQQQPKKGILPLSKLGQTSGCWAGLGTPAPSTPISGGAPQPTSHNALRLGSIRSVVGGKRIPDISATSARFDTP